MSIRLWTLLLTVAVLGSSFAVYGYLGIGVFILVAGFAWMLTTKSFQLSNFLALLLLLCFLLFLCLPAIQRARECARHAMCANNLHQISQAVLLYESQWGCLPPACVRDKSGKPMHSWRVLILPYLERRDLYDQYNFNEPWDSPNNRKLLSARPRIFMCPSDSGACKDRTTTSYVAVVGKNALWHSDKSTSHNQASNSVMLVEVANSGIPWTDPRDFSMDEMRVEGAPPSAGGLSGTHYGGPDGFFFYWPPQRTCVALADGSTLFMPVSVPASKKLKHLLSVGGFNEEDVIFLNRKFNWMNCVALAVWIVSVSLLFHLAWRARRRREQAIEAGNSDP